MGRFELYFVRTRDGKETDFLIVREGVPWILFEAKLSDGKIQSHHYHHAQILGGIPLVQIVKEREIIQEAKDAIRISAQDFWDNCDGKSGQKTTCCYGNIVIYWK